MRSILSAMAMAGLALWCGDLRGAEEAVPLDKLPAVVKEAVAKKFPKAELVKATKEKEKDGDTDYEIAIKDGSTNIEVTVDEKGEIESYEKQIDAKDLPKAVADALEKSYPKASIKKAEAVYEIEKGKDDLEYYEVELTTADKKEVEAKFKPDGSPAKEEAKQESKEEAGKK